MAFRLNYFIVIIYFVPIICRILERKPDTNAFVRTTTAVTMFNAGIKVTIFLFMSSMLNTM